MVLDRYVTAILAGDHAALDALLDPGYQFVSAHARVVDRQQRLTTLAAGPQTLAALTFEGPDVRVIDNVAIVRVAFTAGFLADSGRAGPERGISTLVFCRSRDGWRLCHQHNSHDPR